MPEIRRAAEPQPPALVAGWRLLREWFGVSPSLVLLATLAAIALVFGTLSVNRLCFVEMRFLSEQTAIDAWADRLSGLRRHTLRLHHADLGLIEFRPVDVIPYRDRADFYARNPNCCKALTYTPDLPAPDPVDRLFGKWAYIVSATYTVNYIDRDGSANRTAVTAMAPVTNCGRPWRGY